MKKYLNGKLEVTTGDITTETTDAVVNAANSGLMGGGGVDGAIHRSGGPEILEECKKIRQDDFPDGLPAGQAVITTAGKLAARYVIHTVGPVWHGGNKEEEETLYGAYSNSLLLASQYGLNSISFPAISTGVYGFPKDKAAQTAYNAISGFFKVHKKPGLVRLVFFSSADEETFCKTVDSMEE